MHKSFNKLKWLGVAITPTIVSLHCRWIGYLLGIEWGDGAKAFAVVTVCVVSVIVTLSVASKEFNF